MYNQQFQTPPPGELDSTFDEIDATERLGSGRIPRLGPGQHTVALARFYGHESQRGSGTILTFECIVEKSTTHAPGERRCWQFFPRRGSVDAQKYEKNRVMDFMSSVDACLGMQPRGTKPTGAHLASGQLRGLKLDVNVYQATKRDKQTGVETKILNRQGGPVFNARFSSIAQKPEEIQAKGASMPADPPLPQFQPVVPHAVTQPQYAPPQYQQQPQYAPPQYPQAPQPQYPQYAPPQVPQPQYAPPTQQPQYPQYAPPQVPQPQYAPPQAPPSAQPAPNPLTAIVQGLRGNGG